MIDNANLSVKIRYPPYYDHGSSARARFPYQTLDKTTRSCGDGIWIVKYIKGNERE